MVVQLNNTLLPKDDRSDSGRTDLMADGTARLVHLPGHDALVDHALRLDPFGKGCMISINPDCAGIGNASCGQRLIADPYRPPHTRINSGCCSVFKRFWSRPTPCSHCAFVQYNGRVRAARRKRGDRRLYSEGVSSTGIPE